MWARPAAATRRGEGPVRPVRAQRHGDAGRAARLSRFWQAETSAPGGHGGPHPPAALSRRAPRGDVAPPGQSALVGVFRAARPAYDALQEAWRPVAVYAALPENLSARPGEAVKAPLWVLSRASGGRWRLEAQCLSLEGRVVAMSLTVMLGGRLRRRAGHSPARRGGVTSCACWSCWGRERPGQAGGIIPCAPRWGERPWRPDEPGRGRCWGERRPADEPGGQAAWGCPRRIPGAAARGECALRRYLRVPQRPHVKGWEDGPVSGPGIRPNALPGNPQAGAAA